jgi:hypothetical protein
VGRAQKELTPNPETFRIIGADSLIEEDRSKIVRILLFTLRRDLLYSFFTVWRESPRAYFSGLNS